MSVKIFDLLKMRKKKKELNGKKVNVNERWKNNKNLDSPVCSPFFKPVFYTTEFNYWGNSAQTIQIFKDVI